MIDSYSADEVYADNRHLQCQLNKEKGDVARLREQLEKLQNDHHALLVERDHLFDEAEAGYKIRDSRIRKLEELLLAIEEDACGVYANCSDWFDKRDSLFS